ncbi:unnamed protein product [Owenia fusiformis]|uniref:IMD domain-containing protein n=1 Tax=Owenia fusiformis TaxID=6347 RepID=A0A8S4NEC5_OWEFU|nr:unnamed protein product [Owenia fusiformis]
MEGNIEKECSALGGLFQNIINDMKCSTPVWEDFTSKATKLHHALKATVIACSAFLDTFQKVADLATSSKGATREMGSALTRLCMRHRSIENKLKQFTSSLLDSLVIPLQERMEEWKKTVAVLDKEHAKDYKKARADIKKASSDTVRLQKKAKKGKGEQLQIRLDNAMHDVNDKYHLLEEAEKHSVRTALIEERSRFCTFVSFVRPMVDGEIAMLTEVTHLQEIIEHLCMQSNDPHILPTSSEQVIRDIKGTDSSSWHFQTPPSSPSSLGSRKSSMCSINSINSSSSGSMKSNSPSHHFRYRNSAQVNKQPPVPGTTRLSSVSSQDSGFTSQDTLFLKPATPPPLDLMRQGSGTESGSSSSGTGTESSNASTPCGAGPYPSSPSAASTWTNWPDPPTSKPQEQPVYDRPHTISTAYEKTHNRPALTSQTFQPPEQQQQEMAPPSSHVSLRDRDPSSNPNNRGSNSSLNRRQSERSLDRRDGRSAPPVGPKPKGKPVAPPMVPDLPPPMPHVPDFNMHPANSLMPQPIYLNHNELADLPPPPPHEELDLQQLGEQQIYELHEQQMQSETESGASTPQPWDTLDLSAAIKALDACTADALDPRYDEDSEKARQFATPNSLELAAAIKELEESTAALTMAYDGAEPAPESSRDSQASLQCSSGYGTMTSTPSGSEDMVASQDVATYSHAERAPSIDRFSTIPRSGDVSHTFRAPVTPKRPASTAGMPSAPNPAGQVRRHSVQAKPPPPVRRSSSISAAPPATLPTIRQGGAMAKETQGTQHHRRTHSDVGETNTKLATRRNMTAPEQLYATPIVPGSNISPQMHSGNVAEPMYAIPNKSPGGPQKDYATPQVTPQVTQELQAKLAAMANKQKAPPQVLPKTQGAGSHAHQANPNSQYQAGHNGNVTNGRENVIQSLNAEFAAKQKLQTTNSKPPPGPSKKQSPVANNIDNQTVLNNDLSVNEGSGGFLGQIQRGVKLRRTISNDRSSPRVKRN